MKLTLKELLATNPEVNLKVQELYTALYEGGEKFEQYKDCFIIRRQIECGGGDGSFSSNSHYKERKKRAQYINRTSGLLNSLVALSTKECPKICTDATNEADIEFWEGLNKNVDGANTPFSSLVKQLMTEMLTKKYPYVEVKAEGMVGKDDYRINLLDTQTVLDFEINDNNEIQWIKTHTQRPYRESKFGPADGVEHIVTIYTEESTIVFTFYGRNNEYKDIEGKPIGENDKISSSDIYSVDEHDLGIVPVFRGNATSFHYLMDRISEPVKALYNAEIDLAFALAASAYPQFFLKLEDTNRINQVVKSELSILLLSINESAGYINPDNVSFEALFKNVDRLKNSLIESMRMMSVEASEIPQAGRLSGDAIREIKNPMEAMITALSYPVHDLLIEAIEAIKTLRGDDFNVWIENFGDIDVDEDAMEEIEEYLSEEKQIEIPEESESSEEQEDMEDSEQEN